MSVTPQGGLTFQIVTGGSSVIVVPPGVTGGYITNPSQASDQGLSNSEPLIVDPVSAPTLAGNNTSVALQPGETFTVIANSIYPVRANAASSGHKFTVVYWL